MKLQHLAIGARFEYDGKIFVKTGPLTASSDQGGQQIIPRYAVLRPLDGRTAQASPAPAGPSPAHIRTAFEAFYQVCETLTPAEAKAELAAARERFLASLE